GIGVKSRQGLTLNEEEGVTSSDWSHVIVSYDGSGKGKGVQIYLNGRSVPTEIILDKLAPASFEKGELETGNKDWGTAFKGQLGDVRIYNRRLYANEALELGLLNPLRSVLDVASDRRSEEQ